MGQAKKRGTYEQRKEAAIEDNKRTIQLLKEQEDAWWNSLTPEEQQQVAKNRLKRAQMMSMLAGMTAVANGAPRDPDAIKHWGRLLTNR